MSFGEPVSLATAFGNQRADFEALVRGEIQEPERKEALETRSASSSKSWVIPWWSASLGDGGERDLRGGRRAARDSALGPAPPRLVVQMQNVVGLLKLQGVRLTPAFERDLGEMKEAIAFLERSDLILSGRIIAARSSISRSPPTSSRHLP